MTWLPLIERELRARARNRAFYRLRLAVGVVGALICVSQLLINRPGSLSSLGQSVFSSLALAAFYVCCSGCLWTADVISSEQREGTLGLLFLTHVKELDLLLGKFGSAGLTGLCALTAFIPMMMIPLLVGGVTGGETFRRALVLLNTLFLSLALGLYQSSAHRARSEAVWRSLLALAAIVLLPFLAMNIAGFAQSGVGWLSPLCGMEFADDSRYRTSPQDYWLGLGITHLLAWMLAAGAAFHLRRSVRQTVDGGETALVEETAPQTLCRRHRAPLRPEMNPIAWLVGRQSGIRKVFWAAAAVSVVYHLLWLHTQRRLLGRGVFGLGFLSIQLPGLVVAGVVCGLFAWGASQFLMRARASGELELLLTTSLEPAALVQGQWTALKRGATGPVIAMTLLCWTSILFPAGLWNTTSVAQLGPGGFFYGSAWVWTLQHVLPAVVGSLHTMISVACVGWLAMDLGLRSRTQSGIILRTLLLAMIFPYVLHLACEGYLQTFLFGFYRNRSQSYNFTHQIPSLAAELLVMGYFLWMIGRARRRLGTILRLKDAGSFRLLSRAT